MYCTVVDNLSDLKYLKQFKAEKVHLEVGKDLYPMLLCHLGI